MTTDDDADRRAGAALGRGDLIAAYDIANAALETGDTAPGLQHKRLLALARMGDTRRALAEADRLGLAERGDEDGAALRARLLKDLAFELMPAERPQALIQARDAYVRAHDLNGGYYSAINAATLSLLAGEPAAAERLAATVLADPRVADPRDYYAAATAAEAYLLIGRSADAAKALDRALACSPDAAMRASTLRQLLLLAPALPDPAGARTLAERLRPPPVLYYAGNLFCAAPAAEGRMRREVDAALDELGIMSGFGALAAGADIVIAEALLARGAELNVVLPFAREDFVAASVRPFGEAWLPRFEACLAAAASVAQASDAGFTGDPRQFVYGNELAMGLACLRANHLCTQAVHLALWDGGATLGAGGAAETLATWRATGRAARVIDTGPIDRGARMALRGAAEADGVTRESRAIIFTDYAGFSRLDEQALPTFWREVMGRIGAVLDDAGEEVLFRNTWGDALYAVLAHPAAAAEIALGLQEALSTLDPVAVGLPTGGGMRIALHFGPLYRAEDPVTGGIGYFGTEVTQTARIEPITPIGQVFTTQSFAAFLAVTADRRYATSYVGTVVLAKQFGARAMHRLLRV